MSITRRQLIVGAAAFSALQLLPPIAFGGNTGFEPKNNIFVVGDLHLTRHSNYASKKASTILSSLKALSGGKTGFHLIFNGDMVEFPNIAKTCKNGRWQWEEFARLYISLKEIGFIPHLNFGNHDGSREFAQEVLDGLVPEEHIGNSSFVLGETKFILLSGIHPSKLDCGFLNSELSKKGGGKLVVATHYPPDKLTWVKDKMGEKAGYSLWAKKEILNSISNANASVLCSHSHSPFAGMYVSRGLKRKLQVVGTPSVTYALPYLKTDFVPSRVAGITVLDIRNFLGKAEFFDGKRAFRPTLVQVKSRKGTYEPPHLRIMK